MKALVWVAVAARWSAAIFGPGAVIALFVGFANLGDHFEVGSTFIFSGGVLVLGALILGAGSALVFLNDPGDMPFWAGVLMMVVALFIWFSLGETPQEFCGRDHCSV